MLPLTRDQHASPSSTPIINSWWWPTSRNSKIVITILMALILFQFLTLTLILFQQQQWNDRSTTLSGDSSSKTTNHKRQHASPPGQSVAYVTMMTNDNYFKGVRALSQSLRRVQSKALLYCMVTPSVSTTVQSQMKQDKVCEPIMVQSIASPYTEAVQSRWADTFTKLRVYELVQFSTVIFLDADMIVLHNIDHLFDVLSSSANPNDFQLAAAMDCCDHFNSGLIVLKPSASVFTRLIKGLKSGELKSYDKADQGLLNSYYGKDFVRLDFRYNVDQLHVMHYPHAYDLERDVSVLHFVHVKPWDDRQYETPNGGKFFESEMSELKKMRETWMKIYNQAK